jgi:uncharacterized protein YbjT (DUF2867 family)
MPETRGNAYQLWAPNVKRSLTVVFFTDAEALDKALEGVDAVYLNAATGDMTVINSVVAAMKKAGVRKLIAASILGIYDEVPGAFGEWNRRMVGVGPTRERRVAADFIEQSGLDYTILRLTWLYNEDGNVSYKLTQKDEPFEGAQITRQAVAQLLVNIIKDTSNQYTNTSLGVGEPNTNFDKPSFY